MAVQRPAAGYVEPLALAAAIVASEDGPEDPAEVLSRYARERNELRDIAERNLALANDFTEFVYALKTLVSFEGVPIWKNQLQALANEELEFECLSCNENLVMDLAEPNATVRSFDDAAVSHTRVLSPDPDRLTGSAARMHALAVSHGQTRVAAQLLHVLGTCVCPQCGDRFLVASALAGADDRS
jgi:hypothetical protein